MTTYGNADVLNIAVDVEVNARGVEQTQGDATPSVPSCRIWGSVLWRLHISSTRVMRGMIG